MPAWGNHEWDIPATDDLRNYKGRFDLPNPQTSPGSPAVSCCGEDWYWFDYGNVRFIAYPEPWIGRVGRLERSAPTRSWTRPRPIPRSASSSRSVTGPAYSSGHHPGDATLTDVSRRARRRAQQVRAQPERPQPRLRAHHPAARAWCTSRSASRRRDARAGRHLPVADVRRSRRGRRSAPCAWAPRAAVHRTPAIRGAVPVRSGGRRHQRRQLHAGQRGGRRSRSLRRRSRARSWSPTPRRLHRAH